MAEQKLENIYAKIKNYGIIPVIKNCDPDKAVSVAEALVSGGLNIAEIISPQESIEKITEKISAALPYMLLIHGDMLSEQQIVSATEENFVEQLSDESVMACRCDFIADEKWVKNGEFAQISDSANRAIQKMLGFDLAHVVINCDNAEQAERDAGKIESIFGLKKTDIGTSVANADILHFMKNRSYGKNGQIAICTNFIERAVFYLKESKKDFIEESARFDDDGKLTSIYLDSIVGGFAFKLVRK